MKKNKTLNTIFYIIITLSKAGILAKNHSESIQPHINRKVNYTINDIFINRWSPRAMSGAPITHAELMSLFEAARWSPSSYNEQPWRFIYAYRDTPQWDNLFNLLVPFNQDWAKNAAVLIVIFSYNLSERNNKPLHTHSFDTGAAWMSLALQASTMDLIAHGIGGFDHDKARANLDIPNEYTIEAMIAIGKSGPLNVLSNELQKREVPSDRKKVEEFIFEGKFSE